MSALHGVLVTYRRPRELPLMLEALARQTRQLDTLVIVDNGDPQDPAPLVATAAARAISYLPTGENLGPAGGLHVGCVQVLAAAGADDWVLFLDDDDPPDQPDAIEALATFAEQQRDADPSTGGVGRVGARLDRRRAELRRVPDDELRGAVRVDYVGGGQLPLYLAAALRSAVPDPGLFFGFDDLEVGLRLAGAGRTLYVDGDRWRAVRERYGRLGLEPSLARTEVTASTWRDYYSHRNFVHLLRTHVSTRAAARRSAVVLAKGVRNLPSRPRTAAAALRSTARALGDGWRGRLGRTVDPA